MAELVAKVEKEFAEFYANGPALVAERLPEPVMKFNDNFPPLVATRPENPPAFSAADLSNMGLKHN